MAKKCAYFVNLSTTTKIQSFPFTLGSSIMKSIEILSHLCSGIDRGCSNSTGRVCSDLFCLQIAHSLTYCNTSPLSQTSLRDFCKFWGNPGVLPRVSRVVPSRFFASIWILTLNISNSYSKWCHPPLCTNHPGCCHPLAHKKMCFWSILPTNVRSSQLNLV